MRDFNCYETLKMFEKHVENVYCDNTDHDIKITGNNVGFITLINIFLFVITLLNSYNIVNNENSSRQIFQL